MRFGSPTGCSSCNYQHMREVVINPNIGDVVGLGPCSAPDSGQAGTLAPSNLTLYHLVPIAG